MATRKSNDFAHCSDVDDETRAEIDTLSNDTVQWRNEMSFDRTELDFENEKNDIVQGFMLEKKILTKQHEDDKQGLIERFVKERENMLQDFQDQVKKVEQRLAETPNSASSKHNGDMRQEERFTNTQEQTNNKREASEKNILIRLDNSRLIAPDEFLSSIELEEKFESEKECIERNFRKDKERMKDMLELDYERKYLREKLAHENEIRNLQNDIDHLKQLKSDVGSMWKGQASKLEIKFQSERLELENHYKEETEKLRRRLDRKCASKLQEQKQQYDGCMEELKSELNRLKSDLYESKVDNSRCSEDMKRQLMKEFHENFHHETKVMREQNERLNDELTSVTKEKYELSRKLRDLETSKESECHTLREYSAKLCKEYKSKMQKLTSEIEKLKMNLRSATQASQELEITSKRSLTEVKTIENKLQLTERTLSQCEDTILCLRNQNTNLSHEINLLRTEKDDLQKSIELQVKNERMSKVENKRVEDELKEFTNRYVLLEREKLQHEKLIASLRRELESVSGVKRDTTAKVESYEKESNRLRDLLESERTENKRLHERFQHDADLFRKKDAENQSMRDHLEKLKAEFENMKSKFEVDNKKILKTESENSSLHAQLQRLKSSDGLQRKHELITVQNKYVKEFAKRLDYVKKNYEREISRLKNQLSCSKSQVTCNGDNYSLESKSTFKNSLPEPRFNCFNSSDIDNKNKHTSDWLSEIKHSPYNDKQFPDKPQEYNKSFKPLEAVYPNHLNSYTILNKEPNHPETYDHLGADDNRCKRRDSSLASGLTLPQAKFHPKNEFKYHQSSCHENNGDKNDFVRYKGDRGSRDTSKFNAGKTKQLNERWKSGATSISGSSTTDILSKFDEVGRNSDSSELRKLLKEVRGEVLLLNKIIEEKTPNNSPRVNAAATAGSMQHTHGLFSPQEEKLLGEVLEAKHQTIELKEKLADKEYEVSDSKAKLEKLYTENTELHRLLTQQEEELREHEVSCESLVKRKSTLESLVEKLQDKLREETCRRRQLEQGRNFIMEESLEDLNGSTI